MAELSSSARPASMSPGEGSDVNRSQFERDLADWASANALGMQSSVLIVGGSYRDAHVVYRAGFRTITLSNIEPMADAENRAMPDADLTILYADLEQLGMADASFDVVLAHEVLHHCRSPHRALLEMLRVSRRHVVMMEPNDSMVMRAFIKLRFSFPYELTAVTANDFAKGGVQNSTVPNYIYRWDSRAVYQAVAAALPEREFSLHIRRYWDFNVNAEELARRSETRIGVFTKLLSPVVFLMLLRLFQATANRLPGIAKEGNKFFACITKQDALKPWIVRSGEEYDFKREYARS